MALYVDLRKLYYHHESCLLEVDYLPVIYWRELKTKLFKKTDRQINNGQLK